MTVKRKIHQPQDTRAKKPKITGKEAELLESRKIWGTQEVECALRDGITDMSALTEPGFSSNERHWSVKLSPGTTKEKLVAFISDQRVLIAKQRPCVLDVSLAAFFKAKEAGMIEMKFEGFVRLGHRCPWI